MKCLLSILTALMLAGAVIADEPVAQPVNVAATVDRALAFLTKDALDWRTEHKCVSCHHAGLVVWALRAAKQRGHAVDDTVLADLAKWTSEAGGNGTTGVPRPEGLPKALNEKAVSLALALGADPAPDAVARDGAQRMLLTILGDQTENGSWSAWPETRQPIFGSSDERATAAATLAILQVAAIDDAAAKTVRDKAVQWLTETKTDGDPQSTALRLVLWRRLDKSADQWQPLVDQIKLRQNADGGWSQTPEMSSDAWATGQALYALAHAGFNSQDPAIQRAQAFLASKQRTDGSWPMTSRPIKPGAEGSKSLIPITAAGSAWAVMGLVQSR